jgi:hypothetical protein
MPVLLLPMLAMNRGLRPLPIRYLLELFVHA